MLFSKRPPFESLPHVWSLYPTCSYCSLTFALYSTPNFFLSGGQKSNLSSLASLAPNSWRARGKQLVYLAKGCRFYCLTNISFIKPNFLQIITYDQTKHVLASCCCHLENLQIVLKRYIRSFILNYKLYYSLYISV